MVVELKIPQLGESVAEVTVARIIATSNSLVQVDAEIIEVETDKLNQVLYAPQSGIVTIQVAVGDILKVGSVYGSLEPKQVETKSAKVEVVDAIKESDAVVQKSVSSWVESARQDAQQVAKKSTEAPSKEIRKKLSSLRKVIAQRLLDATRNTAMLTTFNEVDMTEILKLREKYKESFQKKYGVKLGFMSFFAKACISAIQAYPIVNAFIDNDDLVYRASIDLSIAVSTEKGLLVPVIRNADRLSFDEIEKKIEDFALRARSSKIDVDELKGGSFTITNGGVFGSLLSTPIITPPQCAILGMHKIQKRPVVVNDQIVIRQMMYLALSYDHRVMDGKEAVSFLVHIKNCLEEPERLLLGM